MPDGRADEEPALIGLGENSATGGRRGRIVDGRIGHDVPGVERERCDQMQVHVRSIVGPGSGVLYGTDSCDRDGR